MSRIDTLIVKENGIIKIKKYEGENLDTPIYESIFAEINHEELCEYKINEFIYKFMKDISYDDIFNYLTNKFDYEF